MAKHKKDKPDKKDKDKKDKKNRRDKDAAGGAKASKAEKKKEKKARRAGLEPRVISTGRGAPPAEIGGDVVAMFNRGEFKEIEAKWWSPKVTSVEGVGVCMAWEGRKAVLAKNKGWSDGHNLRSASAEGPFVGATGFAVKFQMEVEEKATGKRTAMQEVGVYEVKNGKIIREEFMYGATGEQGSPRPEELAPVGG